MWRRFQRYLHTGSIAAQEQSAVPPQPQPAAGSHATSKTELDMAARLTAMVQASAADLQGSQQLPGAALPKQLPAVQAVAGKQRKRLPASVRFCSAAALPIAAACKAQGGLPAQQVAVLLAAATNTRQVMLIDSW